MTGLDTNVLLRILVDDGSPQVAQARAFAVAEAKSGKLLYIDHIVLVEVIWVLESVFGYARVQCAAVIESLLSNAAYRLEDHEIVEAAWAKFRDTRADFSDCLIAARNAAAGCAYTATFDRAMHPLPTIKLL